jgi:hypothetical protein
MQINRPGTDRKCPEQAVNRPFLSHISAATVTAAKLAILGLDMKNNCTLFVFCLQVLLVGQPKGMMQQTGTHWSVDFFANISVRYALLR